MIVIPDQQLLSLDGDRESSSIPFFSSRLAMTPEEKEKKFAFNEVRKAWYIHETLGLAAFRGPDVATFVSAWARFPQDFLAWKHSLFMVEIVINHQKGDVYLRI